MSAEVLGSAVIPINLGLDKLDRQLAAARAKVEGGTNRMAGSMSKTGATLTRTLTPAAGGFALASKQAFGEWDSGFDSIRNQTGATGAELEDLGESLKKVGANSTQGLGEIGEMMGQVASRTGLTGKPLEDLTTRLLELDRIGNAMSAESASRLFGDWSIAAEDGVESMDRLFRTSQETGVGMERLSDLMVTFGAPMRQLGFDFDTAAVLVGKFEKEGVNTELVMGSMRKALGHMARSNADAAKNQDALTEAQAAYTKAVSEHGEESEQAVDAAAKVGAAEEALAQSMKAADVPAMFRAELEAIKNAGSAGEANARALEMFGQKAGPDMAAAIREGKFSIDDMVDAVANGEETIEKSAADTRDWGDKLLMLRNRVYTVLGPIGEYGMALGGVGMAVGPVISGSGKLVRGLPKVGKALMAIPKGAGRAITSVGSLTKSLILNTAQAGKTAAGAAVSGAKIAASWAATAAKATAAGAKSIAAMALQGAKWAWMGVQALAAAAKVALAWVISMGPILLVAAAVAGLVVLIIKNWDTIKRVTAALWESIKKGVAAAWSWIKSAVGSALNFLKTLFLNFTGPGLLIKHWDSIKRGFVVAKDGIVRTANSLVSFFTGLPRRVASAVSGMWSGITNGFRSAINGVIRMWNNFRIRFDGYDIPGPGPNIPGFTIDTPNLPYLAKGGTAWDSGFAVVGERGPELAWLPQGASVHSNADSGGLLAAAANAGGGDRMAKVDLYMDRNKVGSAVIDFAADHSKRNGYPNPFRKKR